MLTRTIQLLCFACAIAATSRAADEPLIGKWKLNLAKSKLADQMTIGPAGANRYTLTFAGVGDTETLVADGTDQPGVSGSTISITIESPNNWKIVRKQGGRTVVDATWKLSNDGKTLTDTFLGNQPDGSTARVDLVYKRAETSASKSGIPGTWETTEEKLDTAYEIEFRPYEGDGLTFIYSSAGVPKNVKLDGKDYPSVGSDARPGSTSSARRVNEHTLELTAKSNGKVANTREITLSSDGKTLTITDHTAGHSQPNVLVFERQ